MIQGMKAEKCSSACYVTPQVIDALGALGSPKQKLPSQQEGLGTPHGCSPEWINAQDTAMSWGFVHIWGSAILQLTMQWLNEGKAIS
jgi:hypothetical protein